MVDIQELAARTEVNIDMVRMALKAHPLLTPGHNALPHQPSAHSTE